MKPMLDELTAKTSKISEIIDRTPADLKPWPGKMNRLTRGSLRAISQL